VERGGSVQLVGDDQQRAAIGAGGVLRDIAHTHGRSPSCPGSPTRSKGSRPSPLGDSQPEALGFYLDHRRIHVGNLNASTEKVFTAWQTGRSQGLNVIMLAPQP
jgi:hypothetical protein